MAKASLNIFTKSPLLGTVKTRMSPPLSSAQCLRLHQALLNHTLSQMRPLGSPEADLTLCLTGTLEEAMEAAHRLDTQGFGVDVQQGEDLGDRIRNTLATRVQTGYSKVLFIGTDCPRLCWETVRDAMDSLSDRDVVIGPAKDGGYYLVGFSGYVPEILQGIPWGTRAVYEKTVELLRRYSVRWKSLELESDLDTFDDLKQFCRQPWPGGGSNAEMDRGLWATMEDIVQEVCHDSQGPVP